MQSSKHKYFSAMHLKGSRVEKHLPSSVLLWGDVSISVRPTFKRKYKFHTSSLQCIWRSASLLRTWMQQQVKPWISVVLFNKTVAITHLTLPHGFPARRSHFASREVWIQKGVTNAGHFCTHSTAVSSTSRDLGTRNVQRLGILPLRLHLLLLGSYLLCSKEGLCSQLHGSYLRLQVFIGNG